MTKLDTILGGTNYTQVGWSSQQVNDANLTRSSVKETKQQIKDLMLNTMRLADYDPIKFAEAVEKL